MIETPEALAERLQTRFGNQSVRCELGLGEVTMGVPGEHLLGVCQALRDESGLAFEELMDLCGMDYGAYGATEWETSETVSGAGFSRGVERDEGLPGTWKGPRFAVVYHLLSLSHNQRLRLRAFAEGDPPRVSSVVDIWNSANWYEREAFDLFGILFEGHPDLRRILTDYGFIGHPFRKDFPLIGQVEMRYDPEKGRVIYEPVSIEPRTLVPRVIRHEGHYADRHETGEASDA
jgi:NADH-quinone oxidoreductase subunit C